MKKYLALVLAVLMLVAAFAGCGKKDKKEEVKVYGTFHDYSTAIANTLNILITQATAPHDAAGLVTLSLYGTRINDAGDGWEYVLRLASQFPKQVDEAGLIWEVKIRKDAVWANGDAITVDDIIYTYQQYADPIQQNLSASSLTQNSYGQIKNIYEYQMGEKNWDEVGIKKIDEYTFQVEMKEPSVSLNVQRMLNLNLVYKPLYEAGMNADRSATNYGSSIDTYMSAGPFVLTEWEPDAKMVFTRNPKYLYADEITIEKYEIRQIPDTNTAMQLFENGEVDYVDVPYTAWEQYEDDPRFVEYFNDSLMYLFVNLGNPDQGGIHGNLNYRKALYWGADRVEIADTLGVYPAARLVRKAVIGNPLTGGAFVDIPTDYVPDAAKIYDVTKANEFLTKAFEETKQTSVTTRILYSDTATHIKGAAEILQRQYKDTFSGKVTIEMHVVPSGQASTLRRWNPDNPTAYDTALGSLLPGAADPRNTFVYYRSDYSPPRFCYNNPEFDAAYESAMNLDYEKDTDAVVEACMKMEKMLLDDLVIVPMYERPNKVLVQEWIELPGNGYVVGYGFGWRYATISEH